MYNFEISERELKAAAHNMPEALAMEERIAALEEEVKALRQQKREYVESLIENEQFIEGAKQAKLKLINEAVMKALTEMGPDAVLNALSTNRPLPKKPVVTPVKKVVTGVSEVIPVVTGEMKADTNISVTGENPPVEQLTVTEPMSTTTGGNATVKVASHAADYVSELEFEDCNIAVLEPEDMDV